ncbi:Ribosomal protein S18 acetylase RimI [Granulicella pectinivorans]|uniref:Ribosomal protein S18 acetylase RimI n=1 Tax=Granulicella pectinivorans TaxID=474950 RepID=A0A1I6LF50_9BACT|nr:GNAT family N-acetyltransferase [Granulicella pectinivorans]SFS02095.1 Ribosomal protein S18 acetylase RimI [Granulicella pectinivorans]
MTVAVDEISLRACTHDDAQMLSAVSVATFLDAFAGILPGTSMVEHCRVNLSAEKYAHYLGLPRTRIWVAETAVQQGPVGYAMVSAPELPIADPEPTDLELKRIYLLSRFHGGGAGRALMDQAVEGARAQGARRLFLGVYGGNTRALAFYAKAGFAIVGTRRFQMGFEVFDDYVLARGL